MIEADKKFADGMTPDLHPAQVEAYRRMSFQDKIRRFGELYQMAWKLKAAGLRHQHPDWTEEKIQEEVRKIFIRSTTG